VVWPWIEGSGKLITAKEAERRVLEGQTLAFGPKGVLVCPPWMPYRLEADADAVIFSFSDRPVQQALDLWREAY